MAQAHVPSVDSVVCREVTGLVSCTFDELVQRLPAYSWAQVFSAVDRLSRQGALAVSRGVSGTSYPSGRPLHPPPVFARPEVPSAVRSDQLIQSSLKEHHAVREKSGGRGV
jgi:hypothetical protein